MSPRRWVRWARRAPGIQAAGDVEQSPQSCLKSRPQMKGQPRGPSVGTSLLVCLSWGENDIQRPQNASTSIHVFLRSLARGGFVFPEYIVSDQMRTSWNLFGLSRQALLPAGEASQVPAALFRQQGNHHCLFQVRIQRPRSPPTRPTEPRVKGSASTSSIFYLGQRPETLGFNSPGKRERGDDS